MFFIFTARRGQIDGRSAEAGNEDQEDQRRVREIEGGHQNAQGSGTELAQGSGTQSWFCIIYIWDAQGSGTELAQGLNPKLVLYFVLLSCI